MGRTRGAIEVLLTSFHATTVGVVSHAAPPQAIVVFKIDAWSVRLTVPLQTAAEVSDGIKRKRGDEKAAQRRLEQAHRERWRALYLALKAKLVSVETGVETFEEAFLPHLVLAGGSTIFEHLRGQLGSGSVLSDAPLQLGPGGSK